jgi:hypothetical protein
LRPDEEIEDQTKILQQQVFDILAQIEIIGERIGEFDRSLRTLTHKSESHASKEELEALRVHVGDQGGPRSGDAQEIVYMPQLLRVSGNFQNSLKMATKEIDALKEMIGKMVTRPEMMEFAEAVSTALQAQQSADLESTAGGRIAYKCLLCGRPTHQVTGMITDPDIARLVGEPPTSVLGKAGGAFALVYGREGVYRAPPQQQKKRAPPTLPKIAAKSPP